MALELLTTFLVFLARLATMVNMECQQIKNKLHSCDRFVQTSERYSDLMEMSFEDEEEAFLVTFFLSNQPPKVVLGKFTSDKLIGHHRWSTCWSTRLGTQHWWCPAVAQYVLKLTWKKSPRKVLSWYHDMTYKERQSGEELSEIERLYAIIEKFKKQVGIPSCACDWVGLPVWVIRM